MTSAHKTAVTSYNSNHGSYDQFRPSFRSSIVDQFLQDLNLGDDTNLRILELAAGTGKFTRSLVDKGYTNLVVVEPSEGMLQTFHQNFPEIETHLGSSYDIPLKDASVDAVVVAQGFHWFSDEASLEEIKRVLKHGGKFGCIWNYDTYSKLQILNTPLPNVKFLFEDLSPKTAQKLIDGPIEQGTPFEVSKKIYEQRPWCHDVATYIYGYDANVPQYRHGKWRELLKNSKVFPPIEKEGFLLYESLIPEDEVFKYWETRSYITALSDSEKQTVQYNVGSILRNKVTEADRSGDSLKRIMGTHFIVVPKSDNS